MRKSIGAACLVAGTAIGAGMIALPMILAKLGLLPSVALMFGIWAVMYYTSLVSLELNLQAGRGLSLGALAQRYGGRFSQAVGYICFMLLCYALMSAYIYGGGETLINLLKMLHGPTLTHGHAILFFTAGLFTVLLFSLTWVDYINRVLFIKLLGILLLLCIGLMSRVHVSEIPMHEVFDLSAWKVALPVVFTSFGFQVIFHTLTDYCKNDKLVLKKAFFWGSLIPAIVYLFWIACVIGVLNTHNPAFYAQVVQGGVDVGQLMAELSRVAGGRWLQMMVWILTVLAIITSAIGVCLGLIDGWKAHFTGRSTVGHMGIVLVCIVPPALCSWWVPGAFIHALSFAGMILVIIAILLPQYLFYRGKRSGFFKALNYPILGNPGCQAACALIGVGIMIFEIMNLLRL